MSQLPTSVQQFMSDQRTVPASSLWEPAEREFPYAAYHYRVLACLLLSGRVGAKYGGSPNMTDLNRVGKEGNFNQYLSEWIARLLVAGRVLHTTLNSTYEEGPNAERFWQRNPDGLLAVGKDAFLTVAHGPAQRYNWLDPKAGQMHTLDLLKMFFHCFRDKALPEKQVMDALQGFCALPDQDLAELAAGLGLEVGPEKLAAWRHWLDAARTPEALMSALYLAEWAYYHQEERRGAEMWWFPGPTGLAALGLQEPGPIPPLSEELQVSAEGDVRAGAGLPPDRLITLFRHCAVKRFGEVLEFRVDRKRLAAPAGAEPGQELRRALEGAGPLPAKLERLLGTESTQGGKVGVRWCSALVQPENEAVEKAIRQHPQLKNYLEAGAPKGYLMIKAQSRPDSFAVRCRALGFQVTILHGTDQLGD